MMFVSQRKYNALVQQLKMAADSSETYLSMYTTERASNARYRREHTQALQSVSHWQGRAMRAEARLADLQKPTASAGAQAFDRIVKHLDLARLEQRVLTHYAHQVAAHHIAAKIGRQPAAYEGHAGDGGIQRHSIGDEYPFVVYGEEFSGTVRYRVLDTRTGGIYWAKLSSSVAASNFVNRIKAEGRGIQINGRLN